VYPKDTQEKEDIMDYVYRIPCDNCEKTDVGETGRKFGKRLNERKTEVKATINKPFTRSWHLSILSKQNKST